MRPAARAALGLWLGCACAAGAETVTMRSGWQPEFTRLVLRIPEGADWALGRLGTGYALRLPGADFDTTGVFDRIPRARLSALGTGSGQLDLALACDCHARAFLWRPDRLVVDVVDGPAREGSQFERPLELMRPAGRGAGPGPAAPAAPMLPLLPEAVSVPELPVPGVFDKGARSSTEPSAAERALIESVARAASQGLVEMAPAPSPDPQSKPAAIPEALPSRAGQLKPGVAARTSIDREIDEARLTRPLRSDRCLSEAALDLAAAETPRDFDAELGAARRALAGEFDRIAPEAADNLVRTYLRWGFGAEARAALRLAPSSPEREARGAMAALVDGQEAPGLAAQLGCGGAEDLWAALAGAAAPQDSATMDRDGMLQAYALLPDAVQGAIGAALAQRLVEFGDPTGAEIVLKAARNAPGGGTEAATLAEAALGAREGRPEESLADLLTRTRAASHPGPELLLKIAELSESQATALPQDILGLLELARFEQRSAPVGPRLAGAELAARLRLGDFAGAFTLIGEMPSGTAKEDMTALDSRAVLALAEHAAPAEFLTRTLGGLPRPLDAEAENAVAARLLDLGLAKPARAVMRARARGASARERRYLEARIALLEGDHGRVGDLLIGMGDLRADALKQEASDRLASTATAPAGPSSPSGPPPGNSGNNEETSARPGPLAQGRSLLETSAKMRDELSDLLGSLDLPPPVTQ